ncbi:hypothetical protein ACMFMG_003665 [Clarireedia jacksonii]
MSSVNEDRLYKEDIRSTLATNEYPEYEQEALGDPYFFGLHCEGLSMPTCAWQFPRSPIDGQSQDAKRIQLMRGVIAQTVCHAGAHFLPLQTFVRYAATLEARDCYYPHGMVASQEPTLASNKTSSNTRKMHGDHVFAQPGENHTHEPRWNKTSMKSISIGKTNAIPSHERESMTGHKHTTIQHHLPYMPSTLPTAHTGSANVSFALLSSMATTHAHGLPFSSSPLPIHNTNFTQYISPVSLAYNPPRMSEASTEIEGVTNITITASFPHTQSHGPMRFYGELSLTHPGVHNKCQMQLERWAYETCNSR